MAEIRNLTRNGETFYPLTHVEGVLDPEGEYIGNYIENPEFIKAEVDNTGKIFNAVRKDGQAIVGGININEFAEDTKNNIEAIKEISYTVDSSEYIQVKIDPNDSIIEGVSVDGKKRIYIPVFADECTVDKLYSNRLQSNEIQTNKITLSEEGIKNLQHDLSLSTIETNILMQEFSILVGEASGSIEPFIFFSDPHYFTNYSNCEMKKSSYEYLARIYNFFNNTPANFVLCGGDWLTDHKKTTAIEDLGWIDGFMNKLFLDKYYPIFGNHDNNYQGENDDTQDRDANDGALSDRQVINLMFGKYEKMFYSFNGRDTKFYVFNSGTDAWQGMTEYRWEQVHWFANSLLSNSDSHILIALHIVDNAWTSTWGDNITPLSDNITKVADAFNTRTAITVNEITYDFSNSEGTIHAVLCGHTHYDHISILNNIPVFCITTSMFGDFDMILVDYSAKKLKSIRVGYSGGNREMTIV